MISRESIQTHAEPIDKMVHWFAWNSGAPAIQGFDNPEARERMRRAFVGCSKALFERKLILTGPQRMDSEGVIVQLESHTSNLEAPSTGVIGEGIGMPEVVTPGEGAMPHIV
jgi:hypothetical protein